MAKKMVAAYIAAGNVGPAKVNISCSGPDMYGILKIELATALFVTPHASQSPQTPIQSELEDTDSMRREL